MILYPKMNQKKLSEKIIELKFKKGNEVQTELPKKEIRAEKPTPIYPVAIE
jgi:hypothetical protein